MSHLQTSEQAILQLARKHPLLRARDLAGAGLPTIALTQLVSAGKLERVGRGVYSLPNQAVSENRSPRSRSGCPAGLAAWWVLLLCVPAMAAIAESSFSSYPGFAEFFRDYPRRSTPPSPEERALLEKHRPRFFLPAGHAGLIGFYEDYVAQGRFYDGAGKLQPLPVTREHLNRLREDPGARFAHEPRSLNDQTPVVFGRIDHDEADLGRAGPVRFAFLTYHAVFRHSGLAAGLGRWQKLLASIAGNLDDWHQLDHYTAVTLVLDDQHRPVATMLQQHNLLRAWVLGVDLPALTDGRPAVDVAIRSNELYPHASGRREHRVVRFPSPEAMRYLMEAGPAPRFFALDITEPAGEADYRLAFLPADDAFYSFAGFLGEHRRMPGRDGPPGADYNTLPSIKSWPMQMLAGYWRPGNADDLKRLQETYARTGDPADFARAQAHAFGEALTAAAAR